MTIPPDFTPHDGGPCPVDPDTMIRIVLCQGFVKNFMRQCLAGELRWKNIIAYKVEAKP